MKINNVKINSFGNLNNKEIELYDHINIIQGKNESGKSTLLKFIISMFYGISKNKKGKEFSDYDRYNPWNAKEFSGKLSYTLQDGNKYEVFRDFNKKNPIIYNDKSEDISNQFDINKLTGNQFFIEQTKIDENMFLSTLVSMQQEVKLDKNSQNTLIQKVANFALAGDDNISYKKAIEKLNKKQVEEIGTQRTQEKPINIIKQEKEKLEKEKIELINFKNKQYEIEEIKNKIENEIEEDEINLKLIKEINLLNEKQKIENEKINLNKKIILDNKNDIEKLNIEKNKIEEQINIEKDKINIKNNQLNDYQNNTNKTIRHINMMKKILIAIIILLTIIATINVMLIKLPHISKNLYLAIPIGILTYMVLYFIEKNRINKQNKKVQDCADMTKRQTEKLLEEQENNLHKIKMQIEILEKNIENQKINIKKMDEKNNLKFNIEKEKIKNNYSEKTNLEINNYFNNKNLNNEINFLENKLNKNKLELHSLELDKNNIIPKLEKLSLIEEKLEDLTEQEESLSKHNQSIELAKQVLEIAYNKMRDNVTPKFANNLSNNIKKISNGKYKNVKINDEEGIVIEIENGQYISAEKLSIGTIEQLYLSLRFAAIKELTDEDMPIILDEAFAYYDTERLKNILLYLNEEYNNRQIIIFTCTNREKEILDNEKIEYKLIVM